jgi:hypothetical protein
MSAVRASRRCKRSRPSAAGEPPVARSRRRAFVVAASIAAFLGAGSFAWAGTGTGARVSEVVTVPGDQTDSAIARCEKDRSLSGGGFNVTGQGESLAGAFFPVGRRGFKAAATSFGAETTQLTVFGLCDASGRHVIRKRATTAGAQVPETVRVKCPAGSRVSGGGVKVVDDDQRVMQSRPQGKRTWLGSSVYYQTPSETAKQVVYAICDLDPQHYGTRSVLDQAPPLRADRRRGIGATVRLGVACPKGSHATGGGFKQTVSGSTRVLRSSPVGRSWKLRFDTYAGKSTKMRDYVVCEHA